MKEINLIVKYDMEEVHKGKISIHSPDVIKEVDIWGGIELLPSERRNFDNELSALISKYFIANDRTLTEENLKTSFPVATLINYYTNYREMSSSQAYSLIGKYNTGLIQQLTSGDVTELSRSFLTTNPNIGRWGVEEMESRLPIGPNEQKTMVSVSSIRHVLINQLGMSIPEIRALINDHDYSGYKNFVLSGEFDTMVDLKEYESLRDIDVKDVDVFKNIIAYSEEHPITGVPL